MGRERQLVARRSRGARPTRVSCERASAAGPTEGALQLYVMLLRRQDGARLAEHLAAHEARLAELHRVGVVIFAGPFAEGGGLTIFRAASRAEAERIAAEDPFVIHGTHRPELFAWNPWLSPVQEVAR